MKIPSPVLMILFMEQKNKMDIYSVLIDRYEPEKPLKEYKCISTKENGICYRANVEPVRNVAVFQVDGCIINTGNKCDKLILSVNPESTNTWLGHFIELKGQDIHHAISQLESTIANPIFQHNTLSKKYARIVAQSFPANRADPTMERARNRFRERYDCELKNIKSNQPDTI